MRGTIDPKLWDNRKLRDAGLEATGLYVIALSYCADNLTDGFVPAGMLRYLAAGAKRPDSLAKRLVDRELWVRVEGGWEVHDWDDWNPSSDAERERLRRDRERKRNPRGNPSGRPRGNPSGGPTGNPRGTPTGNPRGTPTGTRARAVGGLALGLLSGTPGFTNPRVVPATDGQAGTGVAEPGDSRTAKPQFVAGLTPDQAYNLGRISEAVPAWESVTVSHVESLRFEYGDAAVTEALTRLRDVDLTRVRRPVSYLDSVVDSIANGTEFRHGMRVVS